MICELQRKWSKTIIKRLNLQTQILSKMQIKLGTALRQSDVMLKQLLNEPCFFCTSMSSFEKGPGTGGKIRSFNFCSSSSTYLFQPELGTRYLKTSGAAAIWQNSSGAAAYRYSNKKVAPLPLLACKTAAAAACRCRYFKKINSTKNDGIQIRYLMGKFQLYLRKVII